MALVERHVCGVMLRRYSEHSVFADTVGVIFPQVLFFSNHTQLLVLYPLSLILDLFFFLNDPPPPEISPLSLHAPLPISPPRTGSAPCLRAGRSRSSPSPRTP